MATRTEQPVGSLNMALAQAERLASTRPTLALEQVDEILAVAPGHPQALLVRGRALRLIGQTREARRLLERLAVEQSGSAATALELGLALRADGDLPRAIAQFRHALTLKPAWADAWAILADALRTAGDDAAANAAQLATVRASTQDPVLMRAAMALQDNDLPTAEALLRQQLRTRPGNVAAMRMLAELAARLGRLDDAQALLAQVVQLAPAFDAARQAYAMILQRNNRPAEALREIDVLLAQDPRQGGARTVKAATLVRLGEYDAAIALYEGLLADYPTLARNWMSFGHALKTVGRQNDAVAAYRRATEIEPTLGEAWWSLANLKTYRFGDEAIGAMDGALRVAGISEEDRLHLHFALAKAREDRGEDALAFDHYRSGNALRRDQLGYDPDRIHRQVARTIATFDSAMIRERGGQGCDARDPIFIVGLPRSGSTLVEQILASHPLVEGTMELPDLMAIVRELTGREDRYPERLREAGAEELRNWGEAYLTRTKVQRKTSRPFFIDKMPNNWLHAGLIALILPNAKIIDARRHPMDCCFSAYRQHFARGQAFTYDLEDVGLYYRDYVTAMAHFDAIMPGRIHRVIHERLIEDVEGEVRKLLDHCGLAFDPACLSFWKTDRAVRTASSEQVRRPVNRDGIDRWRRFEGELAPLKTALGPALNDWEAPTRP
ncbi:tetratricopeptide repeat-containing sulfotransferase family protein [Sphingomonas sp.]|uniref:tetratricopeptide repeat-containing sulfotransferase family protein n=1 Tax=Sphingomonas sp. TaxID=28214 RepID=UPI003B3A8FC9